MWIGPVGLAETNSRLMFVPVEHVGVAVVLAGVDDVVDDDALGAGVEPQVDETGAGHLGRGDAVGVGQRRRQPSGQLTRVDADLLAQLQRQVGRVVAVLGIAGSLDGDGRRQR